MPTSGARYYRWNPEDDDWQEAYEHNLSEEDRRLVIESLERHARELGIWQARTWGPRIEDRGSQITFSALGQQAPVEAKEEWDPTNEKKNRLAEAVQKDVPHLAVRSGGSTSVDISNRGVDKAYAFVGDRMDPDGNDYPAALAGTIAIRVTGPEDTLQLCNRIIDWYNRNSR